MNQGDGVLNSSANSINLINAITYSELMSLVFKGREDWLVYNMIPRKSLVVLSGKRASYKSWVELSIALAVAKGTPAFGNELFTTQKTGVLIIDEENGPKILQDRLKMLDSGTDYNIKFLSYRGARLDQKAWLDGLAAFLEQNQDIELIFVDSFRRVIGFDENQAGDINRFLLELKQFAEEHNIAWVLLHHLRKGMPGKFAEDDMDEVRGSSDIANMADVMLFCERPKTIDRLILKQGKCRNAPEFEPQAIELKWAEARDHVDFVSTGTANDLNPTEVSRCQAEIMKWAGLNNFDIFKTKQVSVAMQENRFGKKTIGRALTKLLEERKLVKKIRGVFEVPTGEQRGVSDYGQRDTMD